MSFATKKEVQIAQKIIATPNILPERLQRISEKIYRRIARREQRILNNQKK